MTSNRSRAGIIVLAAVLVFGVSSAALAGGHTDEEQIDAVLDALIDAFNGGDADALAAVYTPDSVDLEEEGPVTLGRQAIRARFAAFVAEVPGVMLVAEPVGLGIYGDVAYAYGTYMLDVPVEGMAFTFEGKYLFILERTDAGWLIALQMFNTPSPIEFDEEAM